MATLALIGVLVAVFLAELLLAITPAPEWLTPSLSTLMALGGVSGQLVFERGEWFRVLTAALLHAGPAHLVLNSIALLVAGGMLEPLIGRVWLLALFVLGAVGGGVASVLLNGPNVVGVGASGAIMGLFGFFLAIAFRFEDRGVRKAFLINGLGTLVPSLAPALIPAITGGDGFGIDYAAHAGGALTGGCVGLAFLFGWRRDAGRPGLQPLAVVIILLAIGVLADGVFHLRRGFGEYRFIAALMPDDALPRTDAAAKAAANTLITRYPNDPRGHFYDALALIDARDLPAAERAISTAVTLAERYPRSFLPGFLQRLRMVQALVLMDLNRPDEARRAAAPACIAPPADILRLLRANKLCP